MIQSREPPVVHVLGAQESNYPWAFELKVVETLNEMGVCVISTDYRRNRRAIGDLISQPADLVLICQGDWIHPADIRRAPCPTALWFAEFLGDVRKERDPAALRNRQMVRYNAHAFDLVLTHEASSIDVLLSLGARRVGCLPTAAVHPRVHRKLEVAHEHDVTFVGNLSARRSAALDALRASVAVNVVKDFDPSSVNELFNRSRIVLNVHAGDVLNLETRVCEAIGAGAFLLSEELAPPAIFEAGKHYAAFRQGDFQGLVQAAQYYLRNDARRSEIAIAGYKHALAHHTLRHRLEALLATANLCDSQAPALDLFTRKLQSAVRWNGLTALLSNRSAEVKASLWGLRQRAGHWRARRRSSRL